MAEFTKICEAKPLRCLIVTGTTYSGIKSYLDTNWMTTRISVEQIIACIIRVGLDNMYSGFVNEEWNLKAIDNFRLRNDPDNHDMVADTILVEELAKFYTCEEKNIRDSVNFVRNFRLYSSEKIQPDDRNYSKFTNDENSIYMHERYRGMIECQPKINITNLRDLDMILSFENLTNLS